MESLNHRYDASSLPITQAQNQSHLASEWEPSNGFPCHSFPAPCLQNCSPGVPILLLQILNSSVRCSKPYTNWLLVTTSGYLLSAEKSPKNFTKSLCFLFTKQTTTLRLHSHTHHPGLIAFISLFHVPVSGLLIALGLIILQFCCFNMILLRAQDAVFSNILTLPSEAHSPP